MENEVLSFLILLNFQFRNFCVSVDHYTPHCLLLLMGLFWVWKILSFIYELLLPAKARCMKTKTKGRAREGQGGPGRAEEGRGGPGRAKEGQGGPGRASNHQLEFHP